MRESGRTTIINLIKNASDRLLFAQGIKPIRNPMQNLGVTDKKKDAPQFHYINACSTLFLPSILAL